MSFRHPAWPRTTRRSELSWGRGTSGQVISVLGTVLFTGLAGVVFCELRHRSGSVPAPAGLHGAVNGLGVLAAAV